jgi:hypothetical protein
VKEDVSGIKMKGKIVSANFGDKFDTDILNNI